MGGRNLLLIGLLLVPLLGLPVLAAPLPDETGFIDWVVNVSAKNNTWQDFAWSSLNVTNPTIVIVKPGGGETYNVTDAVSGSNTTWINKRGSWVAFIYNDTMEVLNNSVLAITEKYTFTNTWDNATGYTGDDQGVQYVDTTSYGDECWLYYYNTSLLVSSDSSVPCLTSGSGNYTPLQAGLWSAAFRVHYNDLGGNITGTNSDIVITDHVTPTPTPIPTTSHADWMNTQQNTIQALIVISIFMAIAAGVIVGVAKQLGGK